jgi:hypothetical protein
MTIRQKLEKYDLDDSSIINHGHLENNRDYQLIGYLLGMNQHSEVKYIFKGCLEVEYKCTVIPAAFSMDDRLLDIKRQEEPGYPDAYIWDAGVINYPGWTLEEGTAVLKNFKQTYGIEFRRFILETNGFTLSIVFHELDIELLGTYKHEIRRLD